MTSSRFGLLEARRKESSGFDASLFHESSATRYVPSAGSFRPPLYAPGRGPRADADFYSKRPEDKIIKTFLLREYRKRDTPHAFPRITDYDEGGSLTLKEITNGRKKKYMKTILR